MRLEIFKDNFEKIAFLSLYAGYLLQLIVFTPQYDGLFLIFIGIFLFLIFFLSNVMFSYPIVIIHHIIYLVSIASIVGYDRYSSAMMINTFFFFPFYLLITYSLFNLFIDLDKLLEQRLIQVKNLRRALFLMSTISIGFVLILFFAYNFFISTNREFIAGEMRSYTQYEVYLAKTKVSDSLGESFTNDKYHLKELKEEILKSFNQVDSFKNKLKLYTDSIDEMRNNISDYQRYIRNIARLKKDLKIAKGELNDFNNDLQDLKNFIAKMETSLKSIELYDNDISNVTLVIQEVQPVYDFYCDAADIISGQAKKNTEYLQKVNDYKQGQKRLREIAAFEANREKKKEAFLTYKQEKYNPLPINEKIDYRTQELLNELKYSRDKYYYDYRYSPSQYEYTTTPYVNPNAAPPVVHVEGYYRSNGTYVAPHVRTAPNHTKTDNLRYK